MPRERIRSVMADISKPPPAAKYQFAKAAECMWDGARVPPTASRFVPAIMIIALGYLLWSREKREADKNAGAFCVRNGGNDLPRVPSMSATAPSLPPLQTHRSVKKLAGECVLIFVLALQTLWRDQSKSQTRLPRHMRMPAWRGEWRRQCQ
jgi:hypothetical protein